MGAEKSKLASEYSSRHIEYEGIKIQNHLEWLVQSANRSMEGKGQDGGEMHPSTGRRGPSKENRRKGRRGEQVKTHLDLRPLGATGSERD